VIDDRAEARLTQLPELICIDQVEEYLMVVHLRQVDCHLTFADDSHIAREVRVAPRTDYFLYRLVTPNNFNRLFIVYGSLVDFFFGRRVFLTYAAQAVGQQSKMILAKVLFG
jgi:hypothetical protein